MSEVQVIEVDGRPAFYVLPAALWQRVRAAVEEAEDVAAYDRALANDDGCRIPAAVAYALADGMHPVRAWREHRGLTQGVLAARADISTAFLSQIERGKRAGTLVTLTKLARALDVPLDSLVSGGESAS